MTSMCCIRCVVYSSLETDFKSTFIGLHAVFKFFMWFSSCHMQHTQRNGCTACNAIKKPKYAMHAREKHNAFNRLCSLRALRYSCACIALHLTAWKLTFKSIFCFLTAVALFRRSARVGLRQPAIGKVLFDDGWEVC